MSTNPSSLTPTAPAQLSSALGTVLDEVLCALETVRVADRTMASDGERLTWIEKVTEAERRVSALKAVLIGEADEAGSAMRARHTRLRDWLAGSGQESPPTGGCGGVEGAGAGAEAEGAGRGGERPDQSGAGRGNQ